MVVYFVYNNNVNYEVFDSKMGTLQKWFNGAKLRLKTKKTEYMNILMKISIVCDIQLQMDSNLFS